MLFIIWFVEVTHVVIVWLSLAQLDSGLLTVQLCQDMCTVNVQEWESQKGAAAEQILLAEAEQAKAKAALKRAKKQKQKARKSQQSSPLSSPTSNEASSSGAVPPSVPLEIPALDQTATSSVEKLQQGLQQIRLGDDATFLAELFCCPLSKVFCQLARATSLCWQAASRSCFMLLHIAQVLCTTGLFCTISM